MGHRGVPHLCSGALSAVHLGAEPDAQQPSGHFGDGGTAGGGAYRYSALPGTGQPHQAAGDGADLWGGGGAQSGTEAGTGDRFRRPIKASDPMK